MAAEKLCRYAEISLGCASRIRSVHLAGCSKRPSSKAAVSEEARRTLRYVELLSEARTPLADFFSVPLEVVRDAAKKVEGAVHAAESKTGRIEIRDCGVVILPLHKGPPFLSRKHL